MTVVEKVGIEIYSQLDMSSFKDSWEKAKKFARDTKKELDPELNFKLELNVVGLQQQLAQVKDQLKRAKKEWDQDWVIKLQLESNRLQSWLTEAKRQLNNFVNTGDKDLSRLQKKFNEVWWWFWGLADTLVGAGITTAVASVSNAVITLAGNLQQARISFWTMLGSASEAEVLLKDLAEFAKNTPFELTGLREQAKLLLAYGFSAGDIIPTLEALGNISAGVGIDKLPRLTYALWQVRSAWKLTGQDFRQFTETGVSLWEELQKITGITEKITSANVAELGITYAQVQQALANLWWESGKFGWLMQAQSQSLQWSISNLKDSLNILWEEIGSIFIPALTGIVKAVGGVVTYFSQLAQTSPMLTKAIALLGGALSLLLVGMWWYVAIAPLIASANTAILSSFIALLWPIALVGGALAILWVAYDRNLLWFRDFANWMIEQWKIIIEFFRILWSEVKPILSEISSSFSSFISGIKEGIWSLSISEWSFSSFFKNLRDIVIDNVIPIVWVIQNMLNLISKIPGVNSILWKAKWNIAQKTVAWFGITSPWSYNAFQPIISTKSNNNNTATTSKSSWWSKKAIDEQTKATEELKKKEQERLELLQKKSTEVFDKMNDKIKKSKDLAEDLKDKLWSVTDEIKGIDESIADRILTLEEQLKTAEWDERLKAEQELALAKWSIDAETLQKARDEALKSETQKLLDKRAVLEEEQKVLQEKYDFELKLQQELADQKLKIEQLFTEKYKIELKKREDELSESINREIRMIAWNRPQMRARDWSSWNTTNITNTNISANINSETDAESLFRKIV